MVDPLNVNRRSTEISFPFIYLFINFYTFFTRSGLPRLVCGGGGGGGGGGGVRGRTRRTPPPPPGYGPAIPNVCIFGSTKNHREHFLQIDQHNRHVTKRLDNFLYHRISSTHVHLRHRGNRHPLGPLPSWIARAVIYPEIFARTMAAILDCPEIFAGRMAAILDLRVHDSNEI